MNLTEEQLNQIEILAGLFFTPLEILISIGLDDDSLDDFETILRTDSKSPVFRAYFKGRLTAEIELRQSIKQSAMNGSNPAQNTMNEYFKNSIL
jgi:hypothetical protein